uniref:Uncharacterized protein n=1 Tax=Arion vulgaris TaxID=1028688 RepID=A0A0B7ANS8_9EUPU
MSSYQLLSQLMSNFFLQSLLTVSDDHHVEQNLGQLQIIAFEAVYCPSYSLHRLPQSSQ